jgi:large subunit ribosomal protein L46
MASLLAVASRSWRAPTRALVGAASGSAFGRIPSLNTVVGNLLIAPLTRSLAAQASTSKTPPAAATAAALSYLESKQAAKDRRRVLFQARQERIERVSSRRAGRRRDEKRQEFREWFIRRKVNDEYMVRKARQAGLEWKHQVAVVLERLPVVLPDIESWEEDYLDLEAHMAQFGKLYPKEFMQQVDDSTPQPTTQEELLQFLPKGYTPASRETEADASGDVRTTDRKLKTSIYLAVQENGSWQLPTVSLKDEEPLLEAVKRAMETKIGSQVEYWCPSNAPFAVELKAAASSSPSESKGDTGDKFYDAKTFFVKIQYDEGNVLKSDLAADDFAWLDRFEMEDRVRLDQGDETARFYKYLL